MSTRTITSWIVPFAEGSAADRFLLGGKGANLAEMTRMGLPVPPGFVVTTEACRSYLERGEAPDELFDQVAGALDDLESATGRRLGDPTTPLLLSVRSGAAFSMPGMMDTVLDLGATPGTVPGLVASGGDRFAWDAVRRFLAMFGHVVLDVPEQRLVADLDTAIAAADVDHERHLTADQLRRVADAHRSTIFDAGAELPADPHDQLRQAILAVFRSWNGERARAYRRAEGIPDDLGTAVTVQAMVFGNLDDRSATGVAFSRDPATVSRSPTATSSSAPRARTSSRGHGRSHTSQSSRGNSLPSTTNCSDISTRSSGTTATCATSSSPSRPTDCGCSRPGLASVRRRPRYGWRSTWSTRG